MSVSRRFESYAVYFFQLFVVPLRLLSPLLVTARSCSLKNRDIKPGIKYVMIANHQSMQDPFIICSQLPLLTLLRLMPFRYFIHIAIFTNPWTRVTSRALGGFPAQQHDRILHGIPKAQESLNSGESVFIFPEGKRSLHNEHRARNGVVQLAYDPKVRFIPARIQWTREGVFGRKFSLAIGKPFDGSKMSAQEILDKMIYGLTLPQ